MTNASHPLRASPPVDAPSLRDKLGICQWFHFQDYEAVTTAARLLKELGILHLRTGISWADFLRPGGSEWYDWQMNALADLDVLLSVWHTPPSITVANACNAPPRRLRDFADFIDTVITRYGERFTHLELWNEPNNRYKWNFIDFDPQWRKFGQMIGDAAFWARQRGCKTVLGGMIPVDHHWLNLMKQYGVMNHIDIVAIHGFPGMWWPDQPNWEWHGHWSGWEQKINYISQYTEGRPVWITETGLATWDLALGREAKYEAQVEALDAAMRANVPRVYWYSLIDLDPQREAIEGFHVDENEYHMGLVKSDGYRKFAWKKAQDLLSVAKEDY